MSGCKRVAGSEEVALKEMKDEWMICLGSILLNRNA